MYGAPETTGVNVGTFLPSGLSALALGGFGIGLADFAVTEPAAGWLISGYAW